MYLRNSYVQYPKLNNALQVLQESSQCIPKSKHSLSGILSLRKPFLKLIAKCRDWFAKTINTSQGRHTIFSATKNFLLHHESIHVQALRFHVLDYHGSARLVLDEVDTLNYGGVSTMPPVPTSIPLHTIFAEIVFAKSNFAIESRNI